MRTNTLRAAAAVFVVLGLLAAAAPASAAPGESHRTPPLLESVTAWLAGLWPGPGPAAPDGPTGFAHPLGSVPDSNGEPTARGTSDSSSENDPTAEPQLGPHADPDG